MRKVYAICAYIYFVFIIKEQKIETHTFMDKIWLYCNKFFSSVGFIPYLSQYTNRQRFYNG